MKITTIALIIGALLSTAGVAAARGKAGPVSGREAKAHISERLQHSSKVWDKTRPFRVQLGGKKGDRIRSFVADNGHAHAVDGSGTRAVSGGNVVEGTLDMKTGAVRTTRVRPTQQIMGTTLLVPASAFLKPYSK